MTVMLMYITSTTNLRNNHRLHIHTRLNLTTSRPADTYSCLRFAEYRAELAVTCILAVHKFGRPTHAVHFFLNPNYSPMLSNSCNAITEVGHAHARITSFALEPSRTFIDTILWSSPPLTKPVNNRIRARENLVNAVVLWIPEI